MPKRNNAREIALDRLRVLEEERAAMVKRRERPSIIRIVSAAYLKLYEEVYGENQTGQRRDCADPRP